MKWLLVSAWLFTMIAIATWSIKGITELEVLTAELNLAASELDFIVTGMNLEITAMTLLLQQAHCEKKEPAVIVTKRNSNGLEDQQTI